jgi:hypothetical protein
MLSSFLPIACSATTVTYHDRPGGSRLDRRPLEGAVKRRDDRGGILQLRIVP